MPLEKDNLLNNHFFLFILVFSYDIFKTINFSLEFKLLILKPTCKDALPLGNFSLAQRTLYHTFSPFTEEFEHAEPKKKRIITMVIKGRILFSLKLSLGMHHSIEILHYQVECLYSCSGVTAD